MRQEGGIASIHYDSRRLAIYRLLSRLTASRALASVLLANLASLVILNGLSLRTHDLLFVYPIALCVFGALMATAWVRRVAIPFPQATLVWAVLFLLCLSLPRLPYLAERFPGHVVLVQGDDYGRLAELVSMTMTDRYPLQHFANQDYLLSHYYAALYPMAFLKVAIPSMTLKEAIVAGNLLYHLLVLFSLAELAARWLPSPRAYVTFLFLCSFFGGLDWLVYAKVLFAHAEHWPRLVFGEIREISSFYTGMLWVIHHFVAFYAILLMLLFSTTLRFRSVRIKVTLLGMLLVGAFYSSLFATFTAFLLGPMQILRLAKRAWTTRAALWLTPIFLTPIFLYTNRVQKASIAWAPLHPGWISWPVADQIFSSLLYVTAASVIDLAGIPFLLLLVRSRFNTRERALFWISMAFLVSTGFVESIGFNNYSMRGMFLPTVVFFYLFSRYFVEWVRGGLRRTAVLLMMVLCAVGMLREMAYMTYLPLMFSTWYWSATGRETPAEVKAIALPKYAALARDASVRFYRPDAVEMTDMHKFNSEKLMQIPIEKMTHAEYELLRYPRRNWFW